MESTLPNTLPGRMQSAANAAKPRVAELDALRGLAALAVMMFHYTSHYHREIGHLQPPPFGFDAGNYGVHLFFLISGFVIFMTLDRTKTAADFVVSRLSRLFPAYWTAMAITAAVVYSVGMPAQRIPLRDLVANLCMVQDLFGFRQLDGSYWTLEIELFFYAQMLGWYTLGLLSRIHWIVAGWLALAVLYALTEQHHRHFSYLLREVLILRHIPFFALGILFYRRYLRSDGLWRDLGLMALSLLAIRIADAPVFFVVALACCAIFAAFVTGWLRWLSMPFFAFFGGISYSLYLLHQAIGFAAMHRLEAAGVPTMAAIAIAIGIAIALATALTRFVERPAMHAIRRWWRARQVASVA